MSGHYPRTPKIIIFVKHTGKEGRSTLGKDCGDFLRNTLWDCAGGGGGPRGAHDAEAHEFEVAGAEGGEGDGALVEDLPAAVRAAGPRDPTVGIWHRESGSDEQTGGNGTNPDWRIRPQCRATGPRLFWI